jgi:predicted nucleic acid-binding protein
MNGPADRFFLDTGFVIARFNCRDQYHSVAKSLAPTIAAGREIWTTDAILFEVAAALSAPHQRAIAISIWDQFHGGDPRYRVCETAGAPLAKAVEMFRRRSDKSWSLTDCLSFVVMEEQQLKLALSADHHFQQAGFRAMLLT